jgi:sec-independent protein translocase protein TatC
MLNIVGIVSYELLGKSRRWLIFLTFLLAAFITPTTDPFTMIALAIPMAILFELAIQFTRINDKRRARRDAAAGWDDVDDDEASPLDARPTALEDVVQEQPVRYDAKT